MITATMKNWSLGAKRRECVAPENPTPLLFGEIFGDAKGRFPDGASIRSSRIMGITNCGDYKVVETLNSSYAIYPNDIDLEYESTFPDAYKRLQ